MTIVELVDSHEGFSIITDKIQTKNKLKLLWIISGIAFFFSAVLDNLATAIVMASLLNKLIKNKNDLWMFGGMVILSCKCRRSMVSYWRCNNYYAILLKNI